ncbi:MAG: hypothetical protein HY094_04350 [Candidatus Melainabacteria bacterium]|nr:hypothetical protein [Candidatus Melainabacteria bacterium]
MLQKITSFLKTAGMTPVSPRRHITKVSFAELMFPFLDKRRLEDVYAALPISDELDGGTANIVLPDKSSGDLIESNFYQAYDCKLQFLDTIINFDLYTSQEILLRGSKTVLGVDGKFPNKEVNNTLRLACLTHFCDYLSMNNDPKALEALSYIYNVARNGKKIVHVTSHGYTSHTSGKWVLSGFDNCDPEVDNVVYKLSLKYDPNEVKAILVNACNPDGIPVHTGYRFIKPVRIPVIAPIDFSKLFKFPARIYWTPGAR